MDDRPLDTRARLAPRDHAHSRDHLVARAGERRAASRGRAARDSGLPSMRPSQTTSVSAASTGRRLRRRDHRRRLGPGQALHRRRAVLSRSGDSSAADTTTRNAMPELGRGCGRGAETPEARTRRRLHDRAQEGRRKTVMMRETRAAGPLRFSTRSSAPCTCRASFWLSTGTPRVEDDRDVHPLHRGLDLVDHVARRTWPPSRASSIAITSGFSSAMAWMPAAAVRDRAHGHFGRLRTPPPPPRGSRGRRR